MCLGGRRERSECIERELNMAVNAPAKGVEIGVGMDLANDRITGGIVAGGVW
jgi:hypothetical protein